MKRVFTIIAVVLLILLASTTGARFAIESTYTEAELLIRVDKAHFMKQHADWTPSRDDYRDYLHSQVDFLTSYYVIQKALRTSGVKRLPIVLNQDRPQRWLSNALEVENPEQSEFIAAKLRIRSDDETAKSILNAIAQAYIKDVVDEEQLRRSESRRRLALRLKIIGDELYSTIRQREDLMPQVQRRNARITMAESKILDLQLAINRESNPATKKKLQGDVELLEEFVVGTESENSAASEVALLDKMIADRKVQYGALSSKVEDLDLALAASSGIQVLQDAQIVGGERRQ